MSADALPVGTRVRLTREVERYPHFIAERGRAGVVVEATPDAVSVRLDEHLPGAEEWDNEVCWYGPDWTGRDARVVALEEVEPV
jgi:hypothetical protein